MNTRQRIAVALVIDGDRIIIGRREKTEELAGYWEFPGGKIEPGESPKQAATRECFEETGVPVRAIDVMDEVHFEYDFGVRELTFVRCQPVDSTSRPRVPFRWAALDTLDQYEFPPANTSAIQQLVAAKQRSRSRSD